MWGHAAGRKRSRKKAAQPKQNDTSTAKSPIPSVAPLQTKVEERVPPRRENFHPKGTNEPHEEIKILTDPAMVHNPKVKDNSSHKPLGLVEIYNGSPDGVINLSSTRLKEWRPKFSRRYDYFSLFRFATVYDIIFMIAGSVAALLSGICIPLIIYYFGKLLRVQILLDKMSCDSSSNSEAATICKLFLAGCRALGEKAFEERDLAKFLNMPAGDPAKVVDFKHGITKKHMKLFIKRELLLTLAFTVLSSVYFFCWNYASQNQGARLRRAYFLSLIHKDMTWFDRQENPEAINRMMENTRRIVEAIGESIPVAMSLTIMCSLCLVLAFYQSWQLSLFALSTLPIIFFSLWVVNRLKASQILKERRCYRVPHDLAQEVFSRMRTVIGYGMQGRERAIYKREISRGDCSIYWTIVQISLAILLMYFVTTGLFALVYYYGMYLITSKSLQIYCSDKHGYNSDDTTELVIVLLCILFGCGNVYLIYTVWKAVQVAKVCGKEVLKVIDAPVGIDCLGKSGLSMKEPLKGKIEFVDVRFTYASSKRLVLNHVSIEAEPNQTVAIVGLSESGKSTILKLICKEYLPDSGFIKLDGHDIRSLNTKWLRSNIGYVPQENVLFDMSIEDNVRMGKLDATFYDVQDACRRAGAHDFIISLKQGYQTRVGHKGCLMGPGEKQSLAVARALIRDPRILLIDEPTYALDSRSTLEFMKSLQKVSKNRTVIIVAHRLATIVQANMIYVLRNGSVVEKGDHQKLIRAKGPYAQLCTTNRLSKSTGGGKKLEGFDSSELTIISHAKTFNQKLMLPNIYNNMLGVDQVICRVTHSILTKDKDTDRGFHAELEWTLMDGEDLPEMTPDDDVYASRIPSKENNDSKTLSSYPSTILPTYPSHMNSPRSSQDKRRSHELEDSNYGSDFYGISMLTCSNHNGIRMMLMASTKILWIIPGALATILFSIGVPLYGLLLPITFDVLSDVTFYPRNWDVLCWFADEFDYPYGVVSFITLWGCYMGVCAFFQNLFLNIAAFQTVQTLRTFVYNCILKQDMSFFDNHKNIPIRLASILFQDTDSLRHLTLGIYETILQCLVVTIVAVAICMYEIIDLTGYTLLIVLCVVGVNFFDGWMAKKQHLRTITCLKETSNLILQIFQSKHVITVCQMEPYFIHEFTNIQKFTMRTITGLSVLRIFTYGLAQSAVFWGLATFMDLGVRRMSERESTIKFFDVMTLGCVLIFGLISLGANLSILVGFKYVFKAGANMLDIIDRKPLAISEGNVTASEDHFKADIELINLNFSRPQSPNIGQLKEINLAISPLQMTAVVGNPESGMSAFVDVLGRFYNPTSGILMFSGMDAASFTSASLREYISVLTKEPELFSRTVAQNIALGVCSRKVTMEEIIVSAKQANVHNLIVSLPEGYETRIGGDHDYLSSAQKHRICLARALLKNPKLLIFDDLTNNLDREGEKSLLDSIWQIKMDRTVIFISRRLQNIIKADWIVAMQKGYLEEQGKHDALLRKRSDGIYAQMWRFQNPLEDDGFVRGTGYNYATEREKSIQVEPDASKLLKKKKSKAAEKVKSEKEETGGCGFFKFLGLGIAEIDENEEVGMSVLEKWFTEK